MKEANNYRTFLHLFTKTFNGVNSIMQVFCFIFLFVAHLLYLWKGLWIVDFLCLGALFWEEDTATGRSWVLA